MEAAWRDARIGRIYEGTNEINRMLSVGMLLKKAMKGDVGFDDCCDGDIGAQIDTPETMAQQTHTGHLAAEQDMVENLKKVFLLVAGSTVQKYGPDLDKNQEILMSLIGYP